LNTHVCGIVNFSEGGSHRSACLALCSFYPLNRRLRDSQSRIGPCNENKSCSCQETNTGCPARGRAGEQCLCDYTSIAWNALSVVLNNFRAGRPGVRLPARARDLTFLQIVQDNTSSYSVGSGVQAAFL